MILTDPIQFIATARQRAIDLLVCQHGVRPYYRDMQLPTTLTFNYPDRFLHGRMATVSPDELGRFRAGGLLNREVTITVSAPGQVTVDFTRLDDAQKTQRIVVSTSTLDTEVMGQAIASFLATGTDAVIVGGPATAK